GDCSAQRDARAEPQTIERSGDDKQNNTHADDEQYRSVLAHITTRARVNGREVFGLARHDAVAFVVATLVRRPPLQSWRPLCPDTLRARRERPPTQTQRSTRVARYPSAGQLECPHSWAK